MHIPEGRTRVALLALVAAAPLMGCHKTNQSNAPERPMPPTCESYTPTPLPRLEIPITRTPAQLLEYDHDSYTPGEFYPRINLGNNLAYTLNSMLVVIDDAAPAPCADGQLHTTGGYAVTASETNGTRVTHFRSEKVTESANSVTVDHGLEFGPFNHFEVTAKGNLVHIYGYEYNVSNASDEVDITIRNGVDAKGQPQSYIWAKGADYKNIVVTQTPDGLIILPNKESRPPF